MTEAAYTCPGGYDCAKDSSCPDEGKLACPPGYFCGSLAGLPLRAAVEAEVRLELDMWSSLGVSGGGGGGSSSSSGGASSGVNVSAGAELVLSPDGWLQTRCP